MAEKFELANFTVFNALHVIAELLKARDAEQPEQARELAAASIIRLNALTAELSMAYQLPCRGTCENRVLKPLAEKAGWL